MELDRLKQHIKNVVKALDDVWYKVAKKLPGGELRRCKAVNRYDMRCIRHYNHFGKHEDCDSLLWINNQRGWRRW